MNEMFNDVSTQDAVGTQTLTKYLITIKYHEYESQESVVHSWGNMWYDL